MINLYKFLAVIENLPEVNWIRDIELNGLRQSVWDSKITNKTIRIDVNREDISEGVALDYLTLFGYPELISQFKEAPMAPPPPIINEDGSLTEVSLQETKLK